MKKVKMQDERVVAETNRIYKIGFYVFTVGIVLDILFKGIGGGPDTVRFDLIEWITFMAAQFTCIVLSARRGIYTEDAMAESFNWKKHLLMFTGAGLLTGVLVSVRNSVLFGLTGKNAILVGLLTTALVCIGVVALGLPLAYASFTWAKARREKQARALENEEH